MNGAVITVLKMAMSTSMVNTFGGITPRSKPTLITTSSMSARVFIMMPRQPASDQVRPQNRAASEHPTNLPNVAAPMMTRHQPQSSGEFKPCTLVRSPLNVKKIGRKNTVTKCETVFFHAATNRA